MPSIFAVTFPFFALVLCGYLAARRGVLPEAAIPGLNAFVLYFALPCLLFRFGASMPFGELIDPVLIGVYAVCALLTVAATVALSWHGRRGTRDGVDLRDAAFGALVTAFPNTGFMGVSLLVALLGPAAAGPVIGTVLVDLVFTSTLCLAMARAPLPKAAEVDRTIDLNGAAKDQHARPRFWRSAAASLRPALSNPLPWSIALGAAVAASGVSLPGPVDQVLKMLGEAASPVALFTIGAVLWRAGQHAHTRTPVRRFLPLALVKLFVHPLLVLGAALAARGLGLPLSDFELTALVLAAALPSASNVSLLAERHGADNGRVARIIMASTVLAFGSFSLWAWALGAGG